MTAIEFQNVSKTFARHAGHMLLRQRIKAWLQHRRREPFLALKNVSFRLNSGEGLAVIGSNGAGKSTLLSLVAGLTVPNTGSVRVTGRIAPLLELGSGFHPDLTGAENIIVNASLIGLGRKRTGDVFAEIVDFAGIGEFIHEPLRTYSSGMVLRLAFSVAIKTDPDILVIDEVLAVGDRAFQQKCFDYLHQIRSEGKTLLCVSHAPGMLQQLCDRAIWLDHGELILSGSLAEVLEAYQGHQSSTSVS